MQVIKEFVREEVKSRKNGRTRLEVTGALYATLDPEDGTLLISYTKLHRTKDQPCKDFENMVLEDRAQVWKYRLAGNKVNFHNGQILIVNPAVEVKGLPKVRKVPYAVTQVLPMFIRRAQKYFQGAPLVEWAGKVLELFPTEI